MLSRVPFLESRTHRRAGCWGPLETPLVPCCCLLLLFLKYYIPRASEAHSVHSSSWSPWGSHLSGITAWLLLKFLLDRKGHWRSFSGTRLALWLLDCQTQSLPRIVETHSLFLMSPHTSPPEYVSFLLQMRGEALPFPSALHMSMPHHSWVHQHCSPNSDFSSVPWGEEMGWFLKSLEFQNSNPNPSCQNFPDDPTKLSFS